MIFSITRNIPELYYVGFGGEKNQIGKREEKEREREEERRSRIRDLETVDQTRFILKQARRSYKSSSTTVIL